MKSKRILLEVADKTSSGILLLPDPAKKVGVVLAHGAGGNMHSHFISYFHEQIARAGYPCLKFNFLYSEARRKVPDPQSVLVSCYEKAMEVVPAKQLVIGGKSMGGRIASYLAERGGVAGLFFLGYPLHAPGKTNQLRDQHLFAIHKPMFFASGTKDPFARFDLLTNLVQQIGTFASTFFVEQGGHSFEVPKKSGRGKEEINRFVAESLISWLDSTF